MRAGTVVLVPAFHDWKNSGDCPHMPTNSGQRRTLSVGTSSRLKHFSAQKSQVRSHEASTVSWLSVREYPSEAYPLRPFCSSSRSKQARHGATPRGKGEPEAMWPRRSFPALRDGGCTPACWSAEVWRRAPCWEAELFAVVSICLRWGPLAYAHREALATASQRVSLEPDVHSTLK